MISQDKRKAIFYLSQQGMGNREIARQLKVDRKTIRNIIESKGAIPEINRIDKIEVDPELLRKIYKECDGWKQRTHEVLTEREKIKIGYSTLCRKLNELGLGGSKLSRCERVLDAPGEEMQHDTTVYFLTIGAKKIKVIASLLYVRYSKVRYLKFYRHFNRFRMKCFFHEALCHLGYCAPICIIDNTNLARLRGAGSQAVITPEMEMFAGKYGFRFKCHALGHANRKAGNERGFYSIETNFLPGRSFETMEDLNKQAFQWATVRMMHRPVGKAKLLPAKAFEYEQSFLKKLPPHVEPPYREHERKIDQYGFVAFDANYYWVPGVKRHWLTLLEYDGVIKLFHQRQLLIQYDLPACDIKNELFSPEGKSKTARTPNNRKKPAEQEERKLRNLSETVDSWLTIALRAKGVKRHWFIRAIYSLYLKLSLSLFLKTIQRAARYRVVDVKTIENIAEHLLKNSNVAIPEVDVDKEFLTREAYLEGRSSDEADLSIYDNLIEES